MPRVSSYPFATTCWSDRGANYLRKIFVYDRNSSLGFYVFLSCETVYFFRRPISRQDYERATVENSQPVMSAYCTPLVLSCKFKRSTPFYTRSYGQQGKAALMFASSHIVVTTLFSIMNISTLRGAQLTHKTSPAAVVVKCVFSLEMVPLASHSGCDILARPCSEA